MPSKKNLESRGANGSKATGEKRAYFNRISGGLVLGMGLGGAMIGYTWLGVIGAVLGLGAGLGLGGSYAEKQRFFRR